MKDSKGFETSSTHMIQNVNKSLTSSSVIAINDKSEYRISKFLIYN